MQKIMAVFSFYLVSFIGIYLIYIFVEPKSNLSIKISENITGQNGVTGFAELALWISVIGAVILLTNHLCGNPTLKAAQAFEQRGILAGFKVLFLKKKTDKHGH